MSQTYDFQLARADAAAVEAEAATLENVRQRALRSEVAWREMAKLTLKMDKGREAARIEKEQRISLENQPSLNAALL